VNHADPQTRMVATLAAGPTPPVQEPAGTLLIVDDDEGVRSLLARQLGSRGYMVVTAANAADMNRELAIRHVDLVILDIMMPGEDGLSACRRLAASPGPPVIILSALGEEDDRILGLEIGADHYLPKPCSVREILAHVRTALRRQRMSAEMRSRNVMTFDGWRMDLDAHELHDPQGVLVLLSDGEFAVLRAFIQRPRCVLTRDQLLHAARGPDSDAFDRAIDIQVSRLRRKLGVRSDTLIRTVRNEGYMFVPKVARASS
jgi:two-component system OmpR family response regulator